MNPWNLIGSAKLLGGATVVIVLWFGYGTIQSVINRYTSMSGELERISKENTLLKSRLESYNLRIDRRDQAINSSSCAEDIKDKIKHPDKIEPPFNPFKPK
jgi:hypothetical protein